MSTTIALQTQIQWRATRSASGHWVGVCDAMDLAMEADSLDELHNLIDETLRLLLLDLLQDNELEQYLRERGWKAKNMPVNRNTDDVEFDVPWQLVTEGTKRDSTGSLN